MARGEAPGGATIAPRASPGAPGTRCRPARPVRPAGPLWRCPVAPFPANGRWQRATGRCRAGGQPGSAAGALAPLPPLTAARPRLLPPACLLQTTWAGGEACCGRSRWMWTSCLRRATPLRCLAHVQARPAAALAAPCRLPACLPLPNAVAGRRVAQPAPRLSIRLSFLQENLCLYGYHDGSWEVTLPVEEVPPELPEPTLGINFARDGAWAGRRRAQDACMSTDRVLLRLLRLLPDGCSPPPRRLNRLLPPCSGRCCAAGMQRADWLCLVAVHADCWLMSMAWYQVGAAAGAAVGVQCVAASWRQ